jgi:hypothetical protein
MDDCIYKILKLTNLFNSRLVCKKSHNIVKLITKQNPILIKVKNSNLEQIFKITSINLNFDLEFLTDWGKVDIPNINNDNILKIIKLTFNNNNISEELLLKCINLKRLGIFNSGYIKQENIDKLLNLKKLIISGGISFTIEKLINLKSLTIYNQIISNEINKLSNLTTLKFKCNTNIPINFDNFINLKKLQINGSDTINEKINNLTNLKNLSLDCVSILKFDILDIPNLKTLEITAMNNIADNNISKFINLKKLRINSEYLKSQITFWGIKRLKKLKKINVSVNWHLINDDLFDIMDTISFLHNNNTLNFLNKEIFEKHFPNLSHSKIYSDFDIKYVKNNFVKFSRKIK